MEDPRITHYENLSNKYFRRFKLYLATFALGAVCLGGNMIYRVEGPTGPKVPQSSEEFVKKNPVAAGGLGLMVVGGIGLAVSGLKTENIERKKRALH